MRSSVSENDCVSALNVALPITVAIVPTSASDVASSRTGISGSRLRASPRISTAYTTIPAAVGPSASGYVQSWPASAPTPR